MNFSHKDEWTLEGAVDALMAYDLGATDSGVKDDTLKNKVREYLEGLTEADFRVVVGKLARKYLTDDMLAQGYGLADVVEFVRWLESELRIYI